jgi:hypothetical protein
MQNRLRGKMLQTELYVARRLSVNAVCEVFNVPARPPESSDVDGSVNRLAFLSLPWPACYGHADSKKGRS